MYLQLDGETTGGERRSVSSSDQMINLSPRCLPASALTFPMVHRCLSASCLRYKRAKGCFCLYWNNAQKHVFFHSDRDSKERCVQLEPVNTSLVSSHHFLTSKTWQPSGCQDQGAALKTDVDPVLRWILNSFQRITAFLRRSSRDF